VARESKPDEGEARGRTDERTSQGTAAEESARRRISFSRRRVRWTALSGTFAPTGAGGVSARLAHPFGVHASHSSKGGASAKVMGGITTAPG